MLVCSGSPSSLGRLAVRTVTTRAPLHTNKLKLYSNPGDEIDGKLLTLRASEVGYYTGEGSSPLQVYNASSSKPGASTLHTYPIGVVDHALGLDCSAGSLCTIVDTVDAPGSQTDAVDLDSWTIGDNGEVSQARVGHWVAKPSSDPGSYDLRWWDGKLALCAAPKVLFI